MRITRLSPLAFLLHSDLSSASSRYRSRPDLSPPTFNITIPATSDVGEGYIFVAPYNSNPTYPNQPAAYIFRSDGDLVWSSLGYIPGFIANFHVAQYKGQNVLVGFQGTIDTSHGHGYGTVAILNEEYELVKNVKGGGHKVLDLHEFQVTPEGTALVEIYDQVIRDLKPWGGKEGQVWIVDAIVQELDLETGAVLFEWHSLDHVDPGDSVVPLGSREKQGLSSFESWDYFHVNSVDKDSESSYLVSGRHVSAIYKLDGKTGEIVWRLGGSKSSFSFTGEEVAFAFQHDARFRGKEGDVEYISLFDNGAGPNGSQRDGKGRAREYSIGKLLKLNTSDWTATLVQEVVHPDRVLGASQGNTQILDNGNFFVNWGQAGTITEFRGNDSQPVFNTYLDSGDAAPGTQNYRAFRQSWTGRPRETPAIEALTTGGGRATIYVSWNGDTETRLWRFYGVVDGNRVLMGQRNRNSFETKFEFDIEEKSIGVDSTVFAVAVNILGSILAQSDEIAFRADITVHDVGRIGSGSDQVVMELR